MFDKDMMEDRYVYNRQKYGKSNKRDWHDTAYEREQGEI